MRRATFAFLLAGMVLSGPLSGARAAEEAPAAAPAASAASTPATQLLVVYVETELREPGLAVAPGPDADLVEWKVPEIGRLLRARLPLLLAANGMSGVFATVKAPVDAAEMAALAGPRPLLVLGISKYTKSGGPFRKAATIILEARFFDRGPPEPPRWRESVAGNVGFDPVLGVLKTNRVDEPWVDDIVRVVLDRMATQGLVTLSGPKAVRPKT